MKLVCQDSGARKSTVRTDHVNVVDAANGKRLKILLATSYRELVGGLEALRLVRQHAATDEKLFTRYATLLHCT